MRIFFMIYVLYNIISLFLHRVFHGIRFNVKKIIRRDDE